MAMRKVSALIDSEGIEDRAVLDMSMVGQSGDACDFSIKLNLLRVRTESKEDTSSCAGESQSRQREQGRSG